ncbi:MAG: hypothetical protein QGD94_02710 [Planctomycetia bacterium]|nr:hypothetical protein [Planctomycetia bacterium]
MSDTLLGMYMHMHWGYNHPYCARRWSIDDWRAYLSGLTALGYNLLQIWPMVDTMPLPLTPSDRAHLEKMKKVITIAHEFEMTVHVGASANTIGNSKAGDYDFVGRPYFVAERLLNPADKAQVRELVEARKVFLEPLAEADGFWIIDSDPGGYQGSTAEEYVHLLAVHRRLLDGLRPGIKLLSWMWAGWTDKHNGEPQRRAWVDAARGLAELDPEPWGFLACQKEHFKIIEDLGLLSRAIYFPYGTIEDEPSYPWTNCSIDRIEGAFTYIPAEKRRLGVMGNAQSHCVQLPHTCFFQHFACGGTKEDVDLQGFAEDVAPGFGKPLADGWHAMGGEDQSAPETALAALGRIPTASPMPVGRLSGLCFGRPGRLVDDLGAQVALKIAILKLREQVSRDGDVNGALRDLVKCLGVWSARLGFSDRYGGPFRALLHPVLEAISAKVAGGERLTEALDAMKGGLIHGAFTQIFEALKSLV